MVTVERILFSLAREFQICLLLNLPRGLELVDDLTARVFGLR